MKSWHELPEQFLTRLKDIIPPDQYQGVLETFTEEKPTTFRINTLKATQKEFRKRAQSEGIQFAEVPWWEHAHILLSPTLRDFTESKVYKEGLCYVQSLSSMIPPLILNPQPSDRILDIAAAPGSKTTQIAALMENSGELIANDNSRIRLYKLEANLKIQGVTNTKITNKHGEIIWQDYPEYFDKILVDVPCSMEGRFTVRNPKSYEYWSTKKVKELMERQKFLLRSAVSAAKPGGVIVYSTCTLAPEENEGVIDWILKKEPGVLSVDMISIPDLHLAPPLQAWNGRQYQEEIKNARRILPTPQMEGFFIAKLTKQDSNISEHVKSLIGTPT